MMELQNEKLARTCASFSEKYVNVAKRFHYIEDKMKRRDTERFNTEKHFITSLEKLQVKKAFSKYVLLRIV